MNARRSVLLAIVLTQLLTLLAMIVRHEYQLRTWQPIRLQVRPIDPEALFRGRYVDLTYDFSRIPTTQTDWENYDTIYIRLSIDPVDDFWKLTEFGRQLENQPGTVIVRGRIEYIYPEIVWVGLTPKVSRFTGRYVLSVRTPIQSYFVSERKAPQLEALPRNKYEMTVDVVVAEDGRAALKQLYVEGIPAEDFNPPQT